MIKQIKIKQKLIDKNENYLDLFKWFSEDAAKIKDKMWTIAAYFYTVLGALLGYAANHLKADANSIRTDEPVMIGIVAVIGCVLSGYGMYMILAYGKHIRTCWNRANWIRYRIEGLSEIWNYDDPDRIKEDEKEKKSIDNRIPKIAERLIVIMGFYFAIYLGLGIMVLLQ